MTWLVRHGIWAVWALAWAVMSPTVGANEEESAAGEPFDQQAHQQALAEMPPGTWLDLGPAQPDPEWGQARGRTWSSKMPYAPDLGGGLLYGEGVHGWFNRETGRYMDDLWLYEVAEHRWRCLWPGTPVEEQAITLNDDGFEVNRDGELMPIAPMVHGYSMLCYDTHNRRFAAMPCPGVYWKKPLAWRAAQHDEAPPNESHASPWMFDVATDRWQRHKTLDRRPPSGFGDVLVYLPQKKQFWFHNFRGDHTTAYYDPATHRWQRVQPTGPKTPFGIEANACLDTRRNRIYVGGGNYPVAEGNALWIYDLENDAWVDPQPAGAPGRLGEGWGTHRAAMHYDSSADRVVLICWRGSPEMLGIHLYDPEANAWTTATGHLPWPERAFNAWSGFYDPKSNRHFVFAAGDSRDNGRIYAYRLAPTEP